jgi:hypothetical protein
MTGTKENPTFMHDMSKVVLIFDTSNEEIPMSPILSNVSFVKQTDGSYLANQVKSPIDAKAGSIKIDVLGRHLYIMDAPGAKPRNILPCSLVSKILKQQK